MDGDGWVGLGILAFDPQLGLWTRYDWRRKARPGVTTYLALIDGKHIFFSNSWGHFVYSLRYDLCAQLALPAYGWIDITPSSDGAAYSIKTEFFGEKKDYVLEVAALERELSRYVKVKH